MLAQPGPRPDQLAQRSATPSDVLTAGTFCFGERILLSPQGNTR